MGESDRDAEAVLRERLLAEQAPTEAVKRVGEAHLSISPEDLTAAEYRELLREVPSVHVRVYSVATDAIRYFYYHTVDDEIVGWRVDEGGYPISGKELEMRLNDSDRVALVPADDSPAPDPENMVEA